MDFSQLFSVSFWFTMNPPALSGVFGWIVLGFFALILLAGIVSGLYADRPGFEGKKDLLQKVMAIAVTMGLFGLILFFFSYEEIRLLGARFWYPIWLVVTMVWSVYAWRQVTGAGARAWREDVQARHEREKYMPQMKRK